MKVSLSFVFICLLAFDVVVDYFFLLVLFCAATICIGMRKFWVLCMTSGLGHRAEWVIVGIMVVLKQM